jgi:hypothetical protein
MEKLIVAVYTSSIIKNSLHISNFIFDFNPDLHP